MRAASPPRQMERENEMIVISHRLFLWTIRAGRDSHALHRHFERSEKSFSFAGKRCISEERKTGNPSSRNLRAKPAIMTQSLVKLRPTSSFRAKRGIFFIRGKTMHKRRTKNGKPVGTPRAKPAIMTQSLVKPRPRAVISSKARNLFHSR